MSELDLDRLTCRCPRCGYELWARRSGEMTLKTSLLKRDERGRVVAKCPRGGCPGIVRVPFLHMGAPPPRGKVRRVRMPRMRMQPALDTGSKS